MTDSEIWKTISGTNEFYQASSFGRIRSVDRTVQRKTRFGLCSVKLKGKILKSIKAKPYFFVHIRISGKQRLFRIHRLVCAAFNGPCPDDKECAHLNGDGYDNRIENLIWATSKENHGHKKIHGTNLEGERHHMAVLTEQDVLEIRKREKGGEKLRSISADFDVNQATVFRAAKRDTWRHI